MRLIDANAVIAEQYDILQKLYGGMEQTLKDHLGIDDDLSIPIHAMERYSRAKQFYFGLKGIMENAPTVDDVSVVRCKDCKWDRPDILLDKHWCSYFLGSMEVRADDFCSYGKRRESNADR